MCRLCRGLDVSRSGSCVALLPNYSWLACHTRQRDDEAYPPGSEVPKYLHRFTSVIVLKGNLCENGAVIKPSAATVPLMQHKRKAVVFENIDDYKIRIDNPDLVVDEKSILILKKLWTKRLSRHA
ncbi:MAG: dihydroxy-acid dehydratase [Ferruginibacter sp.]|nr:dihydroxy-acid dehydratase [Ferruginibacter sp.]